MMKIFNKFFFTIFLVFNISSVFAVTVDTPVNQVIVSFPEHKMSGQDMKGMEVTVHGTSVAIWNGSSASVIDDWELIFNKRRDTDTSGGQWQFTNNGSNPITSVMLDAFGASAVFDKDFIPSGTEGSHRGKFNYSGDATVEFAGAVRVKELSEPVGDLYRWLTFDFTAAGGLLAGESFTFVSDTDGVALEPAVVPIPSAVILFFSGLLGLVGLKHRR